MTNKVNILWFLSINIFDCELVDAVHVIDFVLFVSLQISSFIQFLQQESELSCITINFDFVRLLLLILLFTI